MAISFDAAASTSDGGVPGLSTSHTASGSNRGVLIGIHAEGGVTITGILYGAQTPTLVDSTANGIGHVYFLADPATGGQTVDVDFSGSSTRCAMGIVSYNGSVGALSVAAFENPAEDEFGPNASATISSAAGQLVVDMATCVGTVWAAGAGQTERVSLDDYVSSNRCLGMSEEAGASSVTMSWTGTGAEFTNIIAVALQEASGGTVNTQTLSDTITISDIGLPSKTSGRLGADTLVIFDDGLDYVFANRLGSDSVTVTDGPMEFYSVFGIEAISEVSVSDEFVAWLRRNRLLEDNVLVTDQLISTVIGYLIFISVLTSNVTVTDQAQKTAYFYRLAESNVVTTDQLLRALLVARDLLDGVEVTDSSLTAMQRFILLTDTISVEDALTALYVPETGPATDNPIIRIGFDQPEVMLGGYSVN